MKNLLNWTERFQSMQFYYELAVNNHENSIDEGAYWYFKDEIAHIKRCKKLRDYCVLRINQESQKLITK